MPTPDPAEGPGGPSLLTSADAANKGPADRRQLPVAALRALAEATARRAKRCNAEVERLQAADEIGGRGGLDPTRYGDWEVNGLASDF